MLRVGLTGGLGSGKSTVSAMFARLGAHVVSADELGRQMMQRGEPVFRAIVEHFGPEVVAADGTLDRRVLARLAFAENRVGELNAIVHPAVIERQAELAAALGRSDPAAVLIVESALLFETEHAGAEGWRSRFDYIILVTAPEDLRVERFIARASAGASHRREELAGEARRRMAQQLPEERKISMADFVLENSGTVAELQTLVGPIWERLAAEARRAIPAG